MKVIIAEKPSVGKTIARFFGATNSGEGCILGADVAVTWCFGHLFEQADPEHYGEKYKIWDIENLPILPGKWKLLPKSSGSKQIRIIGELLKKASSVVHAGDPDREGQLLVDEVLEHFRYSGEVKRLWLAALDDSSIRKAIASMKDGAEYRNLKLAAEARSRADWLVGMNLTRAWTLKGRASGHKGVLSVGRVQTPTLAMIVRRDREIEKFQPKDYFDVIGAFPFEAAWQPGENARLDDEGRCLDRNVAELVARRIKGQEAVITKAREEKCSENPPLPHSLSSLQQAAGAKYGLSAAQTLDAAQALYETHKLTTYPRTDCRHLPESMHSEAGSVLSSLPKEYLKLSLSADTSRISGCFNDGQITAHHAIIPTKHGGEIDKLPERERKVYDLIVRAYLSQFYPPHVFQKNHVELRCDGENFAVSGRITLEAGWKVLIEIPSDEEGSKEKPLRFPPSVREGQKFTCSDSRVVAKKTTPPKRYTDGTLIAAMTNVHKLVEDAEIRKRLKETAGIGTEATRAGILETLVKREFVKRQGKSLISTESGRMLIDQLGGSMVASPGMTGLFEQNLEAIATGNIDQQKFLDVQSSFVRKEIDRLREGVSGQSRAEPAKQEGSACPECAKGVMTRRKRKDGKYFWGCSEFPRCKCAADDRNGKPDFSRSKSAA